MKISEAKVGMPVKVLLPSLGYGKIVKVNKTTVWVKFCGAYGGFHTVYDIPHLQFLEENR